MLSAMTVTMAHLMARATLDVQIPPHEVDAALEAWCQQLRTLAKQLVQELATNCD